MKTFCAATILTALCAVALSLTGCKPAGDGGGATGGTATDPISNALFRNKFYVDEFYRLLVKMTHDLLAAFLAWFDKWILDGLGVRGLSGATWGFGFVLRFFQFGNLQGYAFVFGAGVVALIYLMLFAR